LTFKQPTAGSYTKFVFYYKRAIASETVWSVVEVLDKPGSGQNITFKIGPMLGAIYSYKGIVYYTDGKASEYFTVGQFDATGALASQDPSDLTQVVASAWTNPNTTPTGVSARDDYLSAVSINVNALDVAQDPRRFVLTVTQEINAKPLNYDVVGFKVYYKDSTDTYWQEANITNWDNPYVPGLASQLLPFGVGSPETDASVTYSLIVRILYKDGSESSVQHRFMNIPVISRSDLFVKAQGTMTGNTMTITSKLNSNNITNGMIVYAPGITANTRVVSQTSGTTGGAGNYTVTQSSTLTSTVFTINEPAAYPWNPIYGMLGKENVSAYSFITEANAPPGSVGSNANLAVALDSIGSNDATNAIKFYIIPPAVADRDDWRGVRVRYRKVVAGANPAFITQDYRDTFFNGLTVGPVTIPGIVYGEKYEYVITPLYNTYSGGVPTLNESTKSWFLVGTLDTYNSQFYTQNNVNGSWLTSFNPQPLETNIALGRVATSFPQADPTIQIVSFNAIVDPLKVGGLTSTPNTYSQEFLEDASGYQMNSYLSLEYYHAHITGFQELYIYRRVNRPKATPRWTYEGIGQWEKVTVTRTNGSGNVIANFRGPLSDLRFAAKLSGATYIPALTMNAKLIPSSSPPQIAPSAAKAPSTTSPADLFYYSSPHNASTAGHEYLFVVKANGVVSSKGLLVYGVASSPVTGGKIFNQLPGVRPQVVDVANYNNFPAGQLRNLDEARTAVAASKLAFGASLYYADINTKVATFPTLSPGLDT
jgi:hypothetical protein